MKRCSRSPSSAVTLHGCSAAYTDRTLSPAFTMAVDPVGRHAHQSISTDGDSRTR